jgi:hypothetical protein
VGRDPQRAKASEHAAGVVPVVGETDTTVKAGRWRATGSGGTDAYLLPPAAPTKAMFQISICSVCGDEACQLTSMVRHGRACMVCVDCFAELTLGTIPPAPSVEVRRHGSLGGARQVSSDIQYHGEGGSIR